MKKLFILAVLAIFSLGVKAQSLQANYNAAKYQAYDTTTFFLGIGRDDALIYVDWTNFNADDAVLFLGGGTEDGERAQAFTWTGTGVEMDSLILNRTTYLKTIRRHDGTRYKRSYQSFRSTYGSPSNWLTITIVWNGVTTGNLKIFYGDK